MKKLLSLICALFALTATAQNINLTNVTVANRGDLTWKLLCTTNNVARMLPVYLLKVDASNIVGSVAVTNLNLTYVTNNYVYTTNLIVTNAYAEYFTNTFMYVTYETNNYLYTTNIYNDFFTNNYAYVTNLYVDYITNDYTYVTNLFATNIYNEFTTNNYAYITNLFVDYVTNDYTYVTNLFATNIYNEFLTNNYAYITNLYVDNITNNYTYITNLFVTNQYSEFFTNNYSFITNLYVDYITNNYAYITNLYTTNISAKTLYVTNIYGFSGAVDTLTVTNGLTNALLNPSQFIVTDANKRFTSSVNGSSLTNLTLFMTTNPIPAQVLTAGLSYRTNIAGNMTLGAFAGVPDNLTWSIYLYVTNGTDTDRTITFPNGTISQGYGTPPVITVTNTKSAAIQVTGYGQMATNVFWYPFY